MTARSMSISTYQRKWAAPAARAPIPSSFSRWDIRACYLGAIRFVAGKDNIKIADDARVTANVSIGERDDKQGFGIAVVLDVSLPGVDKAKAQDLTKKAHVVCPYSHATKGNIEVKTNIV